MPFKLVVMIDKFIEQETVDGTKPNTLRTYRAFLNRAQQFKDLNTDWTTDDINKFVIVLKKKYNPSSVEVGKGVIRKFWAWAGKKDICTFKLKMPKKTLRRDQILTVEDIEKMIGISKDLMEKAFLAFLFESGARINEILPVRVKYIQYDGKNRMIITIYGTKAGEDFRRIPCVFSDQYIRNYLEICKPADRLFPIAYNTSWKLVKRLGVQAGIDKPLSPHKFRHARATDLALRKNPEAFTKKMLGWVDDSRMIARYTHIVDDDYIEHAFGEGNSSTPKEVMKAAELKEKNNNLELEVTTIRTENEELKARLDARDRELDEIKSKTLDDAMVADLRSLMDEWRKMRERSEAWIGK